MTTVNQRHLLQRGQAVNLLQISDDDFQWLLDTKQLVEILIRGHQLFDSRDIDRLIESYRSTAQRRAQ